MSAIANLLTGQGVDEYFTRTDTLGMRTLLADASGSTLALTDPGGNLLAQYTYEPFGNTTVTGSAFSPYQYTARENDGTGLYYYRARFYSPSLQRFISEDPIGFGGGTNLYAFVGNSPLNFADPYGLLQVCCRPAIIHTQWFYNIACHCFLKLSNGNTLGGYNDGLPDPTGSLNPRKNDPSDKKTASCQDTPPSKCDEPRTLKAFGDLPQDLAYGLPVYGPGGIEDLANTSNTVAAQILKNAGIPYRFPSCAVGANQPLVPIPYWPIRTFKQVFRTQVR